MRTLKEIEPSIENKYLRLLIRIFGLCHARSESKCKSGQSEVDSRESCHKRLDFECYSAIKARIWRRSMRRR